jgi:CHRD domain
MRRLRLFGTPAFVIIAILALVSSVVAADDGGKNRFASNRMNGYQETATQPAAAGGGTGAISTTGTGSFTAVLTGDGTTIRYTLSYEALEGGNVLFAHIHFGRRGVNGGVIAFLCGGGTKPAPCPASGTVTGEIGAADIQGPTNQGIEATQFDEAVRALRAGAVYANVHTARWPGGEIRGQVFEKGAKDADKLGNGDDDD